MLTAEPVASTDELTPTGPPEGKASPGAPAWAKWLVLLWGALTASAGLAFAGVGFVVLLFGGGAMALSASIFLGLAAISFLLGAMLGLQAIQALRRRPSRSLRVPRLRWLVPLFAMVLLGGWALVRFYKGPFLPLAILPFHLLASLLPSLGVISLAQGRSQSLSWRVAILQAAFGAFIAILVALLLEVIALGASTILGSLLGVVGILFQSGTPGLEALGKALQDPNLPLKLQEPAQLYSFIRDYWLFFLPLGISTLGIPPLVEEATKALGVLALGYRKPSRQECFLWGLVSGAAFAAMEDTLFLAGIAPSEWATNMALRLGGSCMHSLGAGLVGLGWYYLLRERRFLPLAGSLLAASTLHGTWNFLAFVETGLQLFVSIHEGNLFLRLLGLVPFALMAGLAILAILALYYLPRRLQAETPKATPSG